MQQQFAAQPRAGYTPLQGPNDHRTEAEIRKVKQRAVLDFVRNIQDAIPQNADGTLNLTEADGERLILLSRQLLRECNGGQERSLHDYISDLNAKINANVSKVTADGLYDARKGEEVVKRFGAYMGKGFVDADVLRKDKGAAANVPFGVWLAVTAALTGVLSFLTEDFYTGTGRKAGEYIASLIYATMGSMNSTLSPYPNRTEGMNLTSDALRITFDVAGIPSNSLLTTFGTWLPIVVFWTLLFDRFPGLRSSRWADADKIALMEKSIAGKLVGKAILITLFTVEPCVTYAAVDKADGDGMFTAMLVGASNFASFFLGLNNLINRISLHYQPAYRKVFWQYLEAQCQYLLNQYKKGSTEEKAALFNAMQKIGAISAISQKSPQECAQLFAELMSISMVQKRYAQDDAQGEAGADNVRYPMQMYQHTSDTVPLVSGDTERFEHLPKEKFDDVRIELGEGKDKFEVYIPKSAPGYVHAIIGGLIILSVAGTFGFVGATYLGVAGAISNPVAGKVLGALAAGLAIPGFAGLSWSATESMAWDIYNRTQGDVSLTDHMDNKIVQVIRYCVLSVFALITSASGGTNGYLNGTTIDAIFAAVMNFKDYLPILWAGIGLGLFSAPLTNVYYTMIALNILFNFLAKNVSGFASDGYKRFAQFVESFQERTIAMVKQDMSDENFRHFLIYCVNLKEPDGKPTFAAKALIAVLLTKLSAEEQLQLNKDTGIDLALFRAHPDFQYDVRFQSEDLLREAAEREASAAREAALAQARQAAKPNHVVLQMGGNGAGRDVTSDFDTVDEENQTPAGGDTTESLQNLLRARQRRHAVRNCCASFWRTAGTVACFPFSKLRQTCCPTDAEKRSARVAEADANTMQPSEVVMEI